MFWKVKHAGEFKTVLVSLLKISSLPVISFFHWGELGSRFQFDFKALTLQSSCFFFVFFYISTFIYQGKIFPNSRECAIK